MRYSTNKSLITIRQKLIRLVKKNRPRKDELTLDLPKCYYVRLDLFEVFEFILRKRCKKCQSSIEDKFTAVIKQKILVQTPIKLKILQKV